MLQIATFQLPGDQDKANEFLATHKPKGEIVFNSGTLFIAFDDGSYPPEHQVADLQELLEGNRNAKFQMEVALHVMQHERADLNPTHNKGRWDELTNGITNTQRQIDIQDLKAAFVERRIAELRGAPTTDETKTREE